MEIGSIVQNSAVFHCVELFGFVNSHDCKLYELCCFCVASIWVHSSVDGFDHNSETFLATLHN